MPSRPRRADEIVEVASKADPETVGRDLFRRVEVFDGGACFELRHRCESAVLKVRELAEQNHDLGSRQ